MPFSPDVTFEDMAGRCAGIWILQEPPDDIAAGQKPCRRQNAKDAGKDQGEERQSKSAARLHQPSPTAYARSVCAKSSPLYRSGTRYPLAQS